MEDPPLHLSLLLLGRVIVAVLGQVAEFTGHLNLAGEVDTPPSGEVLQLGYEPVVGLLGELLYVGHAPRVTTESGGRGVGPGNVETRLTSVSGRLVHLLGGIPAPGDHHSLAHTRPVCAQPSTSVGGFFVPHPFPRRPES